MSELPKDAGCLILAQLADDEALVDEVRKLLVDRFELHGWITRRCRGSLPGCPLDRRGVPLWREMVILEVVLAEQVAGEVFEALRKCAFDHRPDGGMLLMGKSRRLGLGPVGEPATG